MFDISLTVSPIVFVGCPIAAVLFIAATAELAGTPGKAGKSSWDIVNSLGSIAGCLTIPTKIQKSKKITIMCNSYDLAFVRLV